MRSFGLFLFSAAIISGTSAAAHDYAVGQIQIAHPWSRATPPAATIAAGYLTLRNEGAEPDRLMGGSSSVAESVEFHSMEVVDDVARMRKLTEGVEVPAGSEVTLEPRSVHLMLVGIERPLAAGERVPLTLTFEKAGTVDVELAVEAMQPAPPPGVAGEAHGDHAGH